MDEDQIRSSSIEELKELLTSLTLKITTLKQTKKDYVKTLNEIIKTNEKTLALCIDVLNAKDSESARKIFNEVTLLIPKC